VTEPRGWFVNQKGERVEATVKPPKTISFTDLPVSQGARDLMEKVAVYKHTRDCADYVLDVLAAADEKDVRNLLWARRVGKL
jgi:hypothetical protein